MKNYTLTKVRELEKVIFTQHLAAMLKAGISLGDALNSLLDETSSRALKDVLKVLIEDVEGGSKLNKSMAKFPQVFDTLYVGIVRIAEKSGKLDESLQYLADALKKSYSLNKKIKGALLYPALILVSILIVGGAIAIFVLPQLTEFFSLLEIPLPLSTRILVSLGQIFSNYGVLIISALISLMALVVIIFNKSSSFHRRVVALAQRTPIIGRLVQSAYSSTIARSMSLLLTSGIPLAESLLLITDSLPPIPVKYELKNVIDKISEGEKIGQSFLNHAHSFPRLYIQMLAVGEKTGRLDQSFDYLASFYSEIVEEDSKNLSELLEPVMLVIIGIFVGFIALSIIGPIYQLTGNIG